MTLYVALLRAVNLGGTSALPMADLSALCADAGFAAVETFIASGNVVFESTEAPQDVQAALEAKLAVYAGKAVGVLIRRAPEMDGVLAGNPFPDQPGNRTVAIFLPVPPPADALDTVSGQRDDEHIRLGQREIYVAYGSGMGTSKLRIPAAAKGTARNMNTVAKLCALCAKRR